MNYTEPADLYCVECGFRYIDTAADRAQHQEYHVSHLQGLPWLPFNNQQVIFSDDHSLILKIDSSSGSQFVHRAMQLVELGRREHGYDFSLYTENDTRAMVFIKTIGYRAVGLVIIEDITYHGRRPGTLASWPAYRVRLDQVDIGPIPEDPIELPYGLRSVWTARGLRRQGIARELITRAAAHLKISIDRLAWQWPIADNGLALARSLLKDSLYVYTPGDPE